MLHKRGDLPTIWLVAFPEYHYQSLLAVDYRCSIEIGRNNPRKPWNDYGTATDYELGTPAPQFEVGGPLMRGMFVVGVFVVASGGAQAVAVSQIPGPHVASH